MGGELTAIIGALEPALNVVIPCCAPNDLTSFTCRSHACGMWDHADMAEYVDASDLHTLIAPRPLLLLTGAQDPTYLEMVDGPINPLPTLFAHDKEAARRSRIAYGREADPFFVHFLHTEGHTFRVGATSDPAGVQVPVIQSPPGSPGVPWQNDASTSVPRPSWVNLFACIADLCGEYRRRFLDLTLKPVELPACMLPSAGQMLWFWAQASSAVTLGPVHYTWEAAVDGVAVPVVPLPPNRASVTVPNADLVTPPYELVVEVSATAPGFSAQRSLTVLVEDPGTELVVRLLCSLRDLEFPPPPYIKDPSERVQDPAERYRYAYTTLATVHSLAQDLAKASGDILALVAGPPPVAPALAPAEPGQRSQVTEGQVTMNARSTMWQRLWAWLSRQH
jgi:hypothetical protein